MQRSPGATARTCSRSFPEAPQRSAATRCTPCSGASVALLAQLECESDTSVREAILSALTTIGGATAILGLVHCLRSDDIALRNAAIEAMKALPDGVTSIMPGLLNDPDPDVRIFAVNILESLRHHDVEQWLIDIIEYDDHLNVCATAVDLLGEVCTVVSRGPLLRLKARFGDEPYIRFACDVAIMRLGSR
jgi:hypothetical protein